MLKRWIILAVAGLSGCAAANGDGGRGLSSVAAGQCFFGDDVNNFNVKDDQTLYVSTRQGHVFRLEAPQGCFSVGSESIVVAPFASPTPRICVGGQASVSVGQFRAPPVRCVARVSGPITDSSVSGLWARQG